MPRLPTRDDLGAPVQLPTGRQIGRVDTAAIGEGIMTQGRALSQSAESYASASRDAIKVGDQIYKGELKRQEYEANLAYEQFEYEQIQNFSNATQTVTPGQARGFTDRYVGDYFGRAKGLMKNIPDSMKPAIDARLFNLEKKIYSQADQFEREELVRQATNQIEGLVASTLIPQARGDLDNPDIYTRKMSDLIEQNPDLSSTQMDELKRRMAAALGRAHIDALPTSEIERILQENGKSGGPLPKYLESFDPADREWAVNKLEEKRAADLRALNAERAAIDKGLSDVYKVFGSGRTPSPNSIAAIAAAIESGVATPEQVVDYNTITTIMDDREKASRMRPEQLDAGIQQMTAALNKSGTAWTEADVLRVDSLIKLRERMSKELETDPLTLANQLGTFEITPLDFSDPDGIAQSIQQRRKDAATVSDFYGVPTKYLTVPEVIMFKNRLSADNNTADDRLKTISFIAENFGTDAVEVFGELAETGALGIEAHIGGLLTLGPQFYGLAEEALRGQEILKDKQLAPSEDKMSEMSDYFFTEYNELFPDSRTQESANAIFNTARAVYADRFWSKNEIFDSDKFVEIVDEVLGKNGDRGGKGSWRSYDIVLHPDFSQEQFDTFMANLKDDDLVTLSENQRAPVFEHNGVSTPLTADNVRRMHLITVGNGLYEMSLSPPTSLLPQPVLAEGTGERYRIRIDNPPPRKSPETAISRGTGFSTKYMSEVMLRGQT